MARWLPLILALDLAQVHPDLAPLRPGTERAREGLTRIIGRQACPRRVNPPSGKPAAAPIPDRDRWPVPRFRWPRRC